MTKQRRSAAAIVTVAGIVAGVGLFAQAPSDFRSSPFLRIDPDKVVILDSKGQKPCGECHTLEWETWRETKHAKGFDEMHRKDSAKDILTAMDLKLTKRGEALCMRCHYTVGPERKAIAGVSCESCHGPARDWINVHNKKNALSRVADSRAAGMLRPSSDVYGVAANCFECHTVGQEQLVNKGGHNTGTNGFELSSRVHTIRHNFLHDAKSLSENRQDTPERKRVLFVTGRILAYEYALRGMAEATTTGRYATAMNRRVKEAIGELDQLAAANVAVAAEVLKAGAKLRIVPNNKAELEAGAAAIRVIGQKFASTNNGAALAAVDRMVAGELAEIAAEGDGEGDGRGNVPNGNVPNGNRNAEPAAGNGSSPSAAPIPGKTSAQTAGAPPPRSDMPGQIRARPAWFNATGRSGYVGAGKCSSCHSEAEDWWYNDPHATAGKRMFGENPKARRIADYYGIGAAGMSSGRNICMSCHGTVDENTKVVREQGVSCESCHGAGAGYLEAHEKGGNPQKGMFALKQPAARAEKCAGCHRISDERLIAAGHPGGANYDLAANSNKIKHWPGKKPDKGRQKRGEQYPNIADAALRSAFNSAVASRPIPKVAVVAPINAGAAGGGAKPISADASLPADLNRRESADDNRRSSAAENRHSSASVPFSAPPRLRTPSGPLALDPLPTGTEKMTTEELLLLVKKRIERLYSATGRGK